MPPKAKWTTGNPAVNVDAAGTLVTSVPLLDNKVLAATLKFEITADRALKITVENAPGAAGLSDFQAWSTS